MKKKKRIPTNASKSPLPELAVFHRQRLSSYTRDLLEELIGTALPRCVEIARPKSPLRTIRQIEISVLGLRPMAKLHRDFLGIPGPTDVITFPYGEIAICAAVARDRAPEFGNSLTTELALYAIHGLLHLAGYNDLTRRDASRMARLQQNILTSASGKTAKPQSARRNPSADRPPATRPTRDPARDSRSRASRKSP